MSQCYTNIDIDFDIYWHWRIHVIEEANLLSKEDRLDEALKYLKIAKTLFRNSSEISYNLGCIYLQKNEFLSAINEFEEAVKIDNSITDYNINLVISYIKMVNILMSKRTTSVQLNI